MSLTATAATSPAIPTISLHSHGHRKGVHAESNTDSTNTSGQAPATTQGLFSSLLQTLEQVVGVPPIASTAVNALTSATSSTSAAAGTTSTASTTATPTTATSTDGTTATTTTPSQDVQGFLHSLFAALKADQGSTAAATSSAAGSSAGQYQGSLASSLQTLIQQVGSSGTASANPLVSNLNTSFNNLIGGVSDSPAISQANQSPTAPLTNFLNNLLQTVQSNGDRSLSSVGGNVDAKV